MKNLKPIIHGITGGILALIILGIVSFIFYSCFEMAFMPTLLFISIAGIILAFAYTSEDDGGYTD